MKKIISDKEAAGEATREGLAAYVGITAPETPKYLLANNFISEYFDSVGNAEREYNYAVFEGNRTLYTEDDKNSSKLQHSFDCFFKRYLGEDSIREENGRLNKNKHYYFPITQDMLVNSTYTLRHMLFYLQNIGKNFDFKEMQELLGDYIFHDNTGINHIIKILLQNQREKFSLKNNVDTRTYENFWSMLTPTERSRMEKLAYKFNEDMKILLTHRYFRKLDFYRRYNYLATLLTSYVIQYIICRKGSNTCMLCQGAPRDSRLNGAFHRASCNNYAVIRTLFPELLIRFYTDAIKKKFPEEEMLFILAEGNQIVINQIDFNEFIDEALASKRKSNISYEDIVKTFALQEGEKKEFSIEDFVMRYIELTGTKSGSMLNKISSTLATSGRQIDMIFPQNRSAKKYFAMSETLTEFYVRSYLARKNQQYDYLDNFIDDLQSRYKIIIVKSREGERLLKSMRIALSAQEYAKNKAVFIDMLSSINCLIKLSDSGYVITLPEEKGAFKLI